MLPAPCRALPLPDLVAESVSADALTRECVTAEVSGLIGAVVRNDSVQPVTVATRVLFFEDADLDGAYDPARDALLAEAPLPPLGALARSVVTATIAAELSFSDAPIHALVDSGQAVAEGSELNNVVSSAMPPLAPPCPEGPAGSFEEPLLRATFLPGGYPYAWGATASVLVTHLTDDNGDGLFDERDDPTLLAHVKLNAGGDMAAFRGTTGETLFITPRSGQEPPGLPYGWASSRPDADFAVGNLDGDPEPEIVAQSDSDTWPLSRLVMFDHEGNFVWRSDLLPTPSECPAWTAPCTPVGSGNAGAPVIANLDGRGYPEVIFGATVLSNRGKILADADDEQDPVYRARGSCNGSRDALSAVADIDLDGDLELVAGGTVYSFDSQGLHVERRIPDLDGWVGIANFDGDPEAEIVVVAKEEVWLLNVLPGPPTGTGGLVPTWTWSPPAGDGPESWRPEPGDVLGPPTLRDLDGDGAPEILVSNPRRFGAIKAVNLLDPGDSDLPRVLWKVEISIQGANTRSSTAFDLDGDGQQEVLHSDHVRFRILDGLTGSQKFEAECNAVGGFQAPTVADIDNDGHAEVLVASALAPGGGGPLRGVQVHGNENWMPARSAWNQSAYSVTNISDNGAVPRSPVPHWLVPAGDPISDFKCQRSPDLAASCRRQADLTVSRVRSSAPPCGTSVELRALVGNAGSAPTRATIATFYSGDPNLGNARGTAAVPALLPGQSHEATVTVSGEPIFEAVVIVDEGGLVVESDENNNACQAPVGRTCVPAWEKKETNLVYESLLAGHHHDPVEMIARLSDATDPAAAGVPDVFVNFELGTGPTCRALTDADGRARCWLTPTTPQGLLALTVTSDETPHWYAGAASHEYIVGLEETTLVFDAPLVQPAWWHEVEATATLREDGALGLGSEQVSFQVGTGGTAVPATTGPAGQATLTLTGVPHGDQDIITSFTDPTSRHADVTLTTSVHVLGAQVMAMPLAQAGIAGATHQVTATALNDGTPRAGHLMAFRLLPGSTSGSVSGACLPPTCRTDALGSVTWEYTSGVDAGIDTVRAWLDLVENGIQDADEPFADVTVHLRVERATSMSFTTLVADLKSDYSDACAVTARLQEVGGPVVSGEAIEIALGSDACRGETNASGELTCWFTPTLPATTSPATITASFAGNSVLAPAATSESFTIEREETRLVLVSYTFTWSGGLQLFAFRARLTADGALPLEGREVVFTAGSASDAGTTDADGVAEGLLLLPPGVYTVSASFAGDDYYEAVAAPSAEGFVVSPSTPGSFSWVASIAPTPVPTLNDAVARGDGTVEVTFTPGSGDGAPFVTGYLITHGTTRISVSAAEAAVSVPTSRFITGLANGTLHSFKVAAVNDGGPGAISGSDSATPATIPGPPASVTATPLPVSNEIEVAWVDGDDGGSPPIEHGDVLSLPVGTVLEPATNPQLVVASDGVPYSFRVRLKNAAGHGPWSPVTPDVLLGEAPSAPRDLRATPGDGFVTIYWTQPEFLNGGRILRYEVEQIGVATHIVDPADQVTLQVSGTNGVPMSFKVVARNAFGGSTASNTVSITPFGLPDRPATVVVTPTNGAALVQWVQGGNGGGAITGHLAGTLSSLGSPEPAVGPSTRVVTGLANGSDHTLAASAVNARGAGEARDAQPVRTARHPDKPTGITIGLVGDQQVTISWADPAATGSQNIVRSIVTCEPDCGERDAGGATTFTVDQLTNGQPYVFFVRAINETIPEPGTESEPSPPATPRTVPGTPRAFRLAVCGDTKLCVTWAAPAADGGAAIDRYDLSCTSSNGGPQLDVQPVAGARRQVFTSTDFIAPGDTYTCTLTAHNVAGSSLVPASAGPVTVATLPQAPSIGAPSAGDGTASVTWIDLNPGLPSGHADIIGYRVCPIPGGGDCVEVGGDATTATVSDLSNGNTYKLEVRARNIVGLGDPSVTAEFVPCGLPAAPSVVRAVPVAAGEIEVTWPPSWSGGCDIEYTVLRQPGDILVPAGDETSIVIDGLTACTPYRFSVRSSTSAGEAWSPWSAWVPAAEPPSAPQEVATLPGDTCAVVRWTPPADDGCADISHYTITLTRQSSIDPPVVEMVTAAASCVLVTGLVNGATYDVIVVADNVAGTSPAGVPPGPVTPGPPQLESIEFSDSSIAEGEQTIAYVRLKGIPSPNGTSVQVYPDVNPYIVAESVTHFVTCEEARIPVPIHTYAGASPGDTIIASLVGSPDVQAYLTVTGSGGSGGVACAPDIISPAEAGEIFDFGAPENEILAEFDCADWEVRLRMVDDASAAEVVCSGSDGVIDPGDCDLIDPTLMLNGQHELEFWAGGALAATRRFIVTGQQKIGHFALSFTDMTVPLAGIPIQVVRTYDSRDPRVGEFGRGWTLSTRDVRVEKTRPLAGDWMHAYEGSLGSFGWIWHRAEETRRHVVSVTFPDGRVYRFRPVFSLKSDSVVPQAFTWDGLQEGWMHYVPVPPTRGKLAPVPAPPPIEAEVNFDSSSGLMYEHPYDPATEILYEPTTFILTTEDGKKWTVEEGEGLQSVEDRNGTTVTFTANGIVQAPSGRDINFGYNADGTIRWIEDPNGERVNYEYEQVNIGSATLPRLWKLRNRMQPLSGSVFTEFEYAPMAPYQLDKVIDATGLRDSLSCYGPDERLLWVCDASASGTVASICDPGQSTAPAHCIDLSDRDPDLRRQSITDRRGNTTLIEYDARGNVKDRWDRGATAPWHFEYNEDDSVVLERDPLGNETLTMYDANGHVASITHDVDATTTASTCFVHSEDGDLLARIEACDPSNPSASLHRWTSVHDDEGNQISETDPLGATTAYAYDGQGNMITAVGPGGQVSSIA